MDNNTLENIVSPLIDKLYSLSYAIVPNELESEQLLVDAYTRFVVKDKEFILDTQIEDGFDKNSFMDFCLSRLIQEIFSLAKKRNSSFLYSKKKSLDEFNVFYTLNLDSRVVIHLNTVLGFDENKIAQTLLIERHEIVKMMFMAKNELLEIKGQANEY